MPRNDDITFRVDNQHYRLHTARLPRTGGLTSKEVNRATSLCRKVFEAIDVVVEAMHDHERIKTDEILAIIQQHSLDGLWTDRQLLRLYRRANPGLLIGVGGSGLFKRGKEQFDLLTPRNQRPVIVSFAAEAFIQEQKRLMRKRRAA